MGQVSDEAGFTLEIGDTRAEAAHSLRHAAVAIDPPPRGALGIRDLLDLLEKEVGRGFATDAYVYCGTKSFRSGGRDGQRG